MTARPIRVLRALLGGTLLVALAATASADQERVPLADQLADEANRIATGTTSGTAAVTATPAAVTTPSPWVPPPRPPMRIPITPAMAGGVALILIGISFLWAELNATTHGAFAVAGVLCLVAGAAFLLGYTTLAISISWSAVGPLLIAAIGALVWSFYKGVKAMEEPAVGDPNELVGRVVEASGALAPRGKVFLDGSFWNAVSTKPVPDRARVRIVAVEGLTLHVEPVEDPSR